MKAIYFEEHAVRYLAQTSTFQSGEFEDAIDLVQFIRTGNNATIKAISCITSKNIGFIFKRSQNSTLKAIVIDLEKAKGLLEYDDDSLVTILLKIVKFAVKRWENIQVGDSEKYIINNHAVLFPFPYSEKHPIKVLVNLSPAPEFTSKRDMSYLYIAGIGEERFDLNYNNLLNIKVIRDEANEVCINNNKKEVKRTDGIDSLNVTELGDIPKKMNGFLDFDKWMHCLSKKQMDFVTRQLKGSERLEGAAGT